MDINDPGFQFFLARLFGRPFTQTNDEGTVKGYLWRDALYVLEVVEAKPVPQAPGNPFRPSGEVS